MNLAFTIRETFFPLEEAFSSPSALQSFLRQFGWRVEFPEVSLAVGAIGELIGCLEELASLTEELSDGKIGADELLLVTDLAQRLWTNISALTNGSLPNPDDLPNPQLMWESLSDDLPDYLLCELLENNWPVVLGLLKSLGLVVIERVDFDSNQPNRISYLKRSLRLDRIGGLTDNPLLYLQELYQWDGNHFEDVEPSGFALNKLLEELSDLTDAIGLNGRVVPAETSIFPDIVNWDDEKDPLKQYELLLVDTVIASPPANFSFGLVVGPHLSSNEIDGLSISNLSEGAVDASIELPPSFALTLQATGEADGLGVISIAPSGVTAELRPGAGEIASSVTARMISSQPVALVGQPDKSRLALVDSSVSTGFSMAGGQHDIFVGFSADVQLVIAPSQADNFIGSILEGKDIEIDAGLEINFSQQDGLTVGGSAGVEFTIPIYKKLGPIAVDFIRLALALSAEGIEFEGAVTGGLDLAVLAVVVEDIGIKAQLFPVAEGDPPGLFGQLDLKVGFKPPTGLGLAIDAGGIVTGGGYLSIDADIGRYAGIAQVKIFVLGLTAIGIIETKLPDDEDGWSLFLAIFSEFPPIQIGFGFSLVGVGGLIGLHRTIDEDELFGRLITGGLDSIMFPEDPIANAPKIIDDIVSIFPAAQGQFLFGAMFKLGWSVPTIVEADIGLILEIPNPFRIVLLGQVAAYLPSPKATAVELHLDVAGVLNLTEGIFELHAVLRDSHIAKVIHLSGGMAMKAVFEGRPDMILSIGGFHPKFEPPAGFRKPGRITAQIPVGKIADVTLSGYLAITSNTFQAGGRIDIYANLAGFTAEGWLGMDTLIQFSPFMFEVSLEFGVTIRKGNATLMGVDVKARVIGPSPIEIFGNAEFKFLGFEKKIDLHIVTKGKKEKITAKENVTGLVTEALRSPDALTIETGLNVVTLIEDSIAVDPGSNISLRQKIAPLNQELEQFGGAKIEGAKTVSIDRVTLNGAVIANSEISEVDEWFARAQFFKMKDAEKLKAASFEPMVCGVALEDSGSEMPAAVSVAEGYDQIIIGSGKNTKKKKGPKKPSATRKIEVKRSNRRRNVGGTQKAKAQNTKRAA